MCNLMINGLNVLPEYTEIDDTFMWSVLSRLPDSRLGAFIAVQLACIMMHVA